MFTVKFLESLKPKKFPYRVYEKESRPGFGIQVSPKGKKTFFFAYKYSSLEQKPIKGILQIHSIPIDTEYSRKQRFMKLGVYGNKKAQVSLGDARKKWDKWRGVWETGRDPQIIRDKEIRCEEKEYRNAKKKKLKLNQQGSYGDLLGAYLKHLEKNHKVSYEEIERAFNADAYTIIPRSKKAKEVTKDDIDKTLRVIEERGADVMSNRLRSYLSAAFNRGLKANIARGTSEIEFGLKGNIISNVDKSEKKEEAGERDLSTFEVKILWEAIDRSRCNIKTKAILKLLLATGQRVSEVRRLNINEIDFKEKLWELDKTKKFRPHVIPLTDLAMEIIKELSFAENGLLLTISDSGDEFRFDSLNNACKRLCKRTDGLDIFTPRDLRRTWKTLSGKVGITKLDRDKYQNHKTYDTSEKSYDRYDYLIEKRRVAIVWDKYLRDIISGKERKSEVNFLNSDSVTSLLNNLKAHGVSESIINEALSNIA